MEIIEKRCVGFKIFNMEVNSLFFADDGMIFANNKEEAERNIEIIQETSLKYGLEINTSKSNIIIFNKKEDFNELMGIKVVDQIKYLGVTIINKRNIFSKYIEEKIAKAKRLERITYSIIEKSCNRMTIGKVYWKNICLPAILNSFDIMTVKKKDINGLQTIENNVYRKILRAPSYTPIGALRGEVGSSLMSTRMMKGKLTYFRGFFNRNNELLKEIAANPKCKLTKEVDIVLQELGISKIDLMNGSINDIKRK